MLSFPPEPGREVVILGAGFSKSLSDAMPLTGLGRRGALRGRARRGVRRGHWAGDRVGGPAPLPTPRAGPNPRSAALRRVHDDV